jgi:hypothetical protein
MKREGVAENGVRKRQKKEKGPIRVAPSRPSGDVAGRERLKLAGGATFYVEERRFSAASASWNSEGL